jgi:mono/diheme cytochrome c family protein
MIRRFAIWILLGGFCVGLSACSGAKPVSAQTAGQLAPAGKMIYQQYCTKCHGDNGQKINGSALLGENNVLATYQNGQRLYDYASKQMPDDHPGCLSPDQYLQVESYLLLEDGYVKAEAPVTLDKLGQILIEQSP